MNLGQMETETLRYLDDDDAAFWTTTEIDSYINTAYEHYYSIAVDENYAGLLSAPASLNIVAATETVALPSDFFKAKMLERVFPTRTISLTYYDRLDGVGYLTTSDQSYYLPTWKIVGDNISLDPVPQSAYASGLKLHYWPVPTIMSGSSSTPASGFRAPWHRMLPLRAAMIAKGGREENDISALQRMLEPMEVNFMSNLESITAGRKFVEPFFTTEESI